MVLSTRILLTSLTSSLVFSSAWAKVESPPGVPSHEPTAEETIDKALATFAVTDGEVRSLRSLSRTRALLPKVSGTYLRDDLATNLNARLRGDQNVQRDESAAKLTDNYSVSVEWDFRDLAFNPSSVNVYNLVAVQRNLILEVSRSYYLRQQLLIQRATSPPSDPKARHILNLRIREFSTLLDAFTKGWFSAESQRRAQAPTGAQP